MRRAALLLACAALIAATLAQSAHASRSLAVGIADDRLLVNQPDRAPALARQWAAMGIDVVRIHVRWVGVAPAAEASRRPQGFVPSEHRDPAYSWNHVDAAVRAVTDAGMRPLLAITGSGPLWGTRRPSRGNPRHEPDAREFGRFAGAVAARYRGDVRQYVIWNEPNQPAWLQPQSSCSARGRCTPVAPHVYRGLLRTAYRWIKRADPVADVLAGALAPSGRAAVTANRPLRPLAFLRAFGCVDRTYRPVRTGRCRGFKPATFDGLAHHPHGILRAPGLPSLHPDDAALGDLGRLVDRLDRIQDAGGFRVAGAGRAPIHFTEFGYQTDPPDPYSGVTLGRQARWLQQSAAIAWRHPRVQTLIQYEYDDEPVARKSATGRSAYAGWQSGLRTSTGRRKPSYDAFVSPIWQRRDGAVAEIWGQARPGGSHVVSVQVRPVGTSRWKEIAQVRTDSRGAWTLRRRVPRDADHRFAYTQRGETYRSRPLLVPATR